MAKKHVDEVQSAGRFQKVGLILVVVFFIVSVVMVIRNHGGMSVVFSPDTKVITFAHWQLEDGFREGFQAAIADYEKLKAEQGVKVKVNQVAVPVRGYPQWFLTQLIGGQPADVIELIGSSDVHNQYMTALSPYIGRPNPWNKGTPLEKMSWRESFADDMLSALDVSYSEFFGVNIFMHTTRVYVNMKLYEEACGTKKLPDTVTEWLIACKQMREYGKQMNRPVIPIGVRGFDKSTLSQFLSYYNSQLNADFSDFCSPYGYTTATGEILRMINSGELKKERLLQPVELIVEVGQYFADGFSAIDLEQTKYLFFSGNVGFFIDGTWNAFSMVNNSPFPVEVMHIPMLDKNHPLGKNSFGRMTELGSGMSGKFGIPKKTKNFDLALDFLQFITSWKINQQTMIDHCRWMSSLKEVQYEGLMKSFEPISKSSYISVGSPFSGLGTKSSRLTLQRLEKAIILQSKNPQKYFWDDFIDSSYQMMDEISETNQGVMRNMWNMDGTRSALSVGMIVTPSGSQENELFMLRTGINQEGLVSRIKAVDNNILLLEEIPKLKRYDENGN